MQTLKIALRNLLRQRRRTLFTGLSILVGFVLSCFFIGWADGTYNYIIDGFTRNRLGHIQIHKNGYLEKPSLYKTIDGLDGVEEPLSAVKQIDSWTPRIFSAGLVSAGEKSAGANVIGIDPLREDQTTGLSRKLVRGTYFSSRPNEVIIGKELARILKAQVGDSIVIVSQGADGSIANDAYLIIALIDTGDPLLNRSGFYLSLEDAQKLLVLTGRIHEIAITVHNLGQVGSVTKLLRERLHDSGLEVAPWQEFASEFYRAMQADKSGMYLSLVVVIIVVAITILNTILMSVLERQKEYGVLKALGTRPARIVQMVVAETAILTVACVIVGSVIGYALNLYFSIHGIVLPNPIEWGSVQFKYMKGEVNFRSFFLPTVTVTLTSLLVCILPALRAARIEPAKTMRMF
ncbi:MAG TPA: FtsX-like permease family protein [Spirochaetia bacterium]|nr:FtsX-like permease family protein [Spirochaetia bacterium]